ncbi:uncharacterized protein LOC124556397 [Schistocerca americana]|uniref:uncharacterized protein LOC124556397 n=1 Tax=Schistocerca americana TaxID=7009 RepID=UPI001F4F641E|nr:uncharacterized protein LOC124556397 [Schistocerca americana]
MLFFYYIVLLSFSRIYWLRGQKQDIPSAVVCIRDSDLHYISLQIHDSGLHYISLQLMQMYYYKLITLFYRLNATTSKVSPETEKTFRPVSLTSICSRVLEHILYSNIMKYLEENDLLTHSQHAFRKYRSCETQLALYTHEVTSAIDRGCQIDSIFLDFQKAFDTVPHKRLLTKLRAYRVSPQLCDWIHDFLSVRSQFVLIDGKSSSKA